MVVGAGVPGLNILFSKSLEENMMNLRRFISLFMTDGVTLKHKKCLFSKLLSTTCGIQYV